jgi:O-antigen ligase
MFEQHPLLGVGLRNFPVLYQAYTQSLGLAPTSQARAPHNLYLEVAAEGGIVSLAVFLSIVILAYRSLWSSRRRFLQAGLTGYVNLVTGFVVAFTGYMAAAFFVHGAYPRFFYILIGLAFALRALPVQTSDSNQPVSIGQQSHEAA